MADSTVQQVGGDFTTLAAALADAGTGVGDTITIQGPWTVDDTAAAVVADNNITVQIASGNASYHNGFYSTGNNHYRLVVNSAGSHCILVNNTGCIIDGLAISQASIGDSDEGIRLAVDGTITVKNAIIFAPNDVSDQDGIYLGLITGTVNSENVIIYGFNRAGLHPQIFAGADIQTWNINSCTIYDCGSDGEPDGGGISTLLTAGGATYSINIFNSQILASAFDSNEDYNEEGVAGNATWNINNGIASDTSISSRDPGAVGELANRTATDVESPGVGDFVIFRDLTTIDLRLFDNPTENDAQNAHSNISGAGMSLPTLDIEAEIRDTEPGKVDIGADAFPSVNLPLYGQVIFNSADEENRPLYGQRIARGTEE